MQPGPSSLLLWPQGVTENKNEATSKKGIAHDQSRQSTSFVHCSEELENLRGAPIEWADEDQDLQLSVGRTEAGGNLDISSINFPKQDIAQRRSVGKKAKENIHSIPERQSYSTRLDDQARFYSLPSRNRRLDKAPFPPKRASSKAFQEESVSVSATLQRSSSFSGRVQDAELETDNSAEEGSPGESEDKDLCETNNMSFPRRSIRSLRGIASAWTSYATGTPPDTDVEREDFNGSLLTSETHTGMKERGPVRLDKRRMEKAVHLAMEAAFVAEQDEKAWKRKRLRHRRAVSSASMASGRSTPRLGGLAKLAWKRQSIDTSQLSRDNMCEDRNKQAVVVTKNKGGSSDEQDGLDGSDTSDDASPSDGFSMDLYISSLGYLLSALRPEDVAGIPNEQRRELSGKLYEAINQLHQQDRVHGRTMTQQQEVVFLQIQQNLAVLQGDVEGSSSRKLYNADELETIPTQDTTASDTRNRTSTLTGFLATTALDFGLSIGASVVATASRSMGVLLPSNRPGQNPDYYDTNVITKKGSNHQSSIPENTTRRFQQPQTGGSDPQWELTTSLAGSLAKTLYSSMAAIARNPPRESSTSKELAKHPDSGAGVISKSQVEDHEETHHRLVVLSTTLARSVKRSPLPTQVRALTSQTIAFAQAVDRRFEIRRRSVNVALRKTSEVLAYVRRNDLHVRAVRLAWSVVEAGVAAVEAYRDEEEWHDANERPKLGAHSQDPDSSVRRLKT